MPKRQKPPQRSRPPSVPLEQYLYNETRYTQLKQGHPEEAKKLLAEAQQDVAARWKMYETWASVGAGGKG